MKILEKVALILFSIIILIISVISCLVIFDIVELQNISEYINDVIQNETVSRTILVISIVCILLSIKALFFPSKTRKKDEIKTGVLLENKDGRLLISKDTIENLIDSIAKSFEDALDVQTKVYLDADNNITVYISLFVKEDVVIRELSSEIQTKIKETVKRSTDLDVNQININVKNIETSQNNIKCLGEGKNCNKQETQYSNSVVKGDNKSARIKIENVQINDNKDHTKDDCIDTNNV